MRSISKMLSFTLIGLLAGSALAGETRYTIEQWPADLSSLPCSAFIKEPNGSWSLNGIIVVRSMNQVISEDFYVKGNAVAAIIENKCGDPFDPLHLETIERATRFIAR